MKLDDIYIYQNPFCHLLKLMGDKSNILTIFFDRIEFESIWPRLYYGDKYICALDFDEDGILELQRQWGKIMAEEIENKQKEDK